VVRSADRPAMAAATCRAMGWPWLMNSLPSAGNNGSTVTEPSLSRVYSRLVLLPAASRAFNSTVSGVLTLRANGRENRYSPAAAPGSTLTG
tara:strand:- start:85308 stop:85580 length:273 start_codon:yes stop_codon:yes gene_type:complete